MISWIVKELGWKFLTGAAVALIGEWAARPALVGVVKGGLVVQRSASDALAQARAELAKIHSEAKGGLEKDVDAAAGILEELRALRSELAELKAQVGA